MSGSDDDWFEKDIDEFVVQAQQSNNVEHITGSAVPDADGSVFMNPTSPDNDYGGCYASQRNSKKSSKNQSGNSNSSPNDSPSKTAYIQPISFKKLSYICDQTPLNIFLDIIQADSGFLETLNRSSNSTEMILLTLKVIMKFIETPFLEHIRIFLNEVRNKVNYWKQIECMLKETTFKVKPVTITKQKKKTNKVVLHRNETELWQQILILSETFLKFKNLPDGFLWNILAIIKGNKNDSLNLTLFEKKFEELSVSSTPLNELEEGGEHTDEYKTYYKMNIHPTLIELKEKQTNYVFPNIINGRYNNVEHYLNTHLALLREDFISPLRDGICKLIKESSDDPEASPKSNLNVRVYQDVRILIKQHKISEKANFKNEYLMVDLEAATRSESDSYDPNNNSKYSKKLMYGSLLCFTTSTKFDDLVIATVSNRDVDLLSQGYIQIEIIQTYNINDVFGKDLLMCESDVYFESYRHVYGVLKGFTEETFPMKNYIIDADTTAQFPTYIPAHGKIIFTYKQNTLDLKNTSTWPTASSMYFNDSQLDALKHALTRKFSVIQGPPGCGKTHMGLAIVATLLMNTDSQILIISQTNHALDQFLTGIIRYTDSIVRIGNQSKNEQLDCFNIKQLCENGITDKRIKTSLYKLKCAYADAVQEINDLRKSVVDEKKTENEALPKYTHIQMKLQSILRMQEEIKQIADYQVIKSKRIIGMTSTGAARCNSLVHLLQTPIVVVEEAAEILESHVVAALTKSVQHLLLIGDHQQLRPTTSVYELAKKFKMDVSLFERMINNNMHCVTLNTQYRMRPEIANLIRPTIYKELLDSDGVLKYPKVLGMAKNLYFINHNEMESKETDEITKKNAFESKFLVALCNYLIVQGYDAEDITILTMYNGQIFQFAQDRKKYPNLRKVRITAVDNFQGEDNKIILLSLVRSNTSNNIGFLAFKNRICVALSRAKHGLYIIGNMTVLSKASKIWNEINVALKNQQAIGNELELMCTTHKITQKVSDAATLDELKYGGCQNLCNIPMNCGHGCTLMCHTSSFKHFSDCSCNFN